MWDIYSKPREPDKSICVKSKQNKKGLKFEVFR